jgi:exonuclease SbcD
MKLLHTADWHLGKRLNRVDRADDLRRAVERVFAYCESESADALLIAGDLFDTVCRADDVCAAIDHLKDAARPFLERGGTILATTGNHDGETFCRTLQHTLALAAPSDARSGDMLAPGRFHLITRPSLHRLVDPQGREVQFVLMPYPLASRYLDDASASYSGGAEGKHRRLREAFTDTLGRIRGGRGFDPARPAVLAAHLFLAGARLPGGREVTPDDEKADIVCPPRDLGAGWAYVALGHVHRPQALGGQPHVRYSGSIERLNFDERDDAKQVVLVEIDERGLRTEPVSLPLEASPFLDVIVREPAAELPRWEAEFPRGTPALVRCQVVYRAGTDDLDEIHRRLDALFPRCYVRVIAEEGRASSPSATAQAADDARRVPQLRRGFRVTVMGYLQRRLAEHPDAEAILAAADGLIAEEPA